MAGLKLLPPCEHAEAKGFKFCPICGVPQIQRGLNKVVGDYIAEHQEQMYGVTPEGNMTDSCKWYEHEEAMKELSKVIPNALFVLRGECEESGDIWNKYFLDGKMQACKAKIVYDEFDPKKLV